MRTLLALLLTCGSAWGQTCTIVTDGTVAIYEHELAHCNGWRHKPFEADIPTPPEFVYPYRGVLTVYMTGSNYSEQADTMLLLPYDARLIFLNEEPEVICQQLWRERGWTVPAEHDGRLVGCAVQ